VDQNRASGWPIEDTGGRRLSRRGWKGFVVTLSMVFVIVLEASAAQDVGAEIVRMDQPSAEICSTLLPRPSALSIVSNFRHSQSPLLMVIKHEAKPQSR